MADKCILDIYIFFVATSKMEATSSHTTVCVESHEWIDCRPGYLSGKSYFDAQKVETISKDELLSKTRDQSNQFKHVGTMPEKKRTDFEIAKKRAATKTDSSASKKSVLLASIVPDENDSLNILKQLGLKT